MTIEEATADLKSEGKWDDFVARQAAKNKEIAEREARLRIEEKPLLADLRSVGWNVETVWDLVNTSAKYTEAIPVLLNHLLLPYSDTIRGGIARSLAVPEAREAWHTLAREYRNAPKADGLGAQHGLAVALAATASDEVLGELIELAKDRAFGESRVLLLSALKRSKNVAVREALKQLSSDPDLKKEIASWRRRDILTK